MTPELTPATPRNRTAIVGRMTRYAVVCELDGQRTVIGFSGRKSRVVLLSFARYKVDAILPFVGDDDRSSYARGVLTLGPRVRLFFGETERRS